MSKEKQARKYAIWMIVGMILIWIVLSIFSFTNDEARERPRTDNVSFNGVSAFKGKQVFQAYNCMDCHTIVGNGGYFAPDLTKTYEQTGAAWLKAYLGSPATYPTEPIVKVQLNQLIESGETDIVDIDDYLERYKGAKERLEKRAGVEALMPNLKFTAEEIDALIAYMKYASMINTGGWPAEVIAKQSVIDAEARRLEEKSGIYNAKAQSVPVVVGDDKPGSLAAEGFKVAENMACMACHSSDGSEVVGPTFKGLYQDNVELADGTNVIADEEYLRRSILEPNAEVVKGYPEGVMPSFEGIISDAEMDALIEYIKSLK